MKGIVILGNGGGGTSLLRGLLHAHPDLYIDFEFGRTLNMVPEDELMEWVDKRTNHTPLIWGNKVPIEQFITRKWSDANIVSIIDYFKVIWLFRRYSKYIKPQTKGKALNTYKKNWEWGQSLYWGMRERDPYSVIQVSFEDLLLRPDIELTRICQFIDIKFIGEMLKGTMDTGYKKYDQEGLDVSKV